MGGGSKWEGWGGGFKGGGGFLYLQAQQCSDTRLGGVADGRQVVPPLQSQHHAAPRQRHQLLGQVAKTWRGVGRRGRSAAS